MNDNHADMHSKINSMSDDVSFMRGQWEATLPNLATKDQVDLKISAHVQGEHKEKRTSTVAKPYNNNAKTISTLLGVVVVLTTVIGFLIKHFG